MSVPQEQLIIMCNEYNRVVVEYSNGITEVKDYSQYLRTGYQRKVDKVKHGRLCTYNCDLGRKKNNKKFNPDNVQKTYIELKQKLECCVIIIQISSIVS